MVLWFYGFVLYDFMFYGVMVVWFYDVLCIFIVFWFSRCMLLWFLGSKNVTQLSFRVFRKILIPHPIFQDFVRRIVGILRCPSFPKLTKMDFPNVQIWKILFKNLCPQFLVLFKVCLHKKGVIMSWFDRVCVDFLKVPKMSKRIWQTMRTLEFAILQQVRQTKNN